MTDPNETSPLLAYRQLVFDCDGVLFDSNQLKEENIRQAAGGVCEPEVADRFVEYFTRHNGIPREEKINSFFGDPVVCESILAHYNDLNASSVRLLQPDPATRAFVERAASLGLPLYVLSGAAQDELIDLLECAGIAPFFEGIFGGPTSKMAHIERMGLTGPTCFFGDSLYDYEVAMRAGFDFVFMTRYSQFRDWKDFFSDKPHIKVAHDFRSINW